MFLICSESSSRNKRQQDDHTLWRKWTGYFSAVAIAADSLDSAQFVMTHEYEGGGLTYASVASAGKFNLLPGASHTLASS